MFFRENCFSASELFLLIIFTLISFLIIKYYYNQRKFFQLGAKLPGPKPWPIVGSALDFVASDFDILSKLREYQKNRPLTAVWLGHHLFVFIHTPDLAEAYCQSTKLLNRSEKSKFLTLGQKGLILANGAQWRKAKKLMESALPHSNLKTFIPIFQKEASILVERLQCEVGEPCFSLSSYLMKCVFDIITEVTVELKEKAQNSETALQEDVDLFVELGFKRVVHVWQHWDFLYKFLSEGKEFYRIIDSVTKIANDVINQNRMKYDDEKEKLRSDENLEKTKRKKFWQVLLDDGTLSLDEIRDHIFSAVVAGYETSANATCFAVVMLALHPDVQEKAYQEVVSIIDGDFDEEKVHKLEYLEMVIKETLRLFPAGPIAIRSATEDIQIGDYIIPAGSDVGLNIYQLHRDPKQYDQPDKFNPDNFLPENIAKRHKYSFLPFSGGLRKCIGSKFAMYQMKVVVSILLLHYKFECDYKTMADVKVRTFITLGMQDGFQVRILKR